MIRYHVRCCHCATRRCLRKHPDQFASLPRCSVCGRRTYRLDRWMNRRDTTKTRCDCEGYWFPHRRGSLFCWYRSDGTGRFPGDTDFADRNYDGLAA
ncbi:hypothetical protein J2794_001663 [Paraburkholderia terricola]|uniref:hypothetical protein n=2 Tax=Paraburkholderia terricola TaxID=169427 RepID=UPI002859E799|nr:hypothetical protein [Paraburkholderia terricola]MDR6445572.1 hypothetical protein [Paraburkholderia terricola]